MDLKDLKIISMAGEGQHVEFKKNLNNPEQIIEEVVGFANASGGSVFIGIDDNGVLNGLKYAEDDVIFLNTYLPESITPGPEYKIDSIPVTRTKSVIQIKVISGNLKPYGLINKSTQSRKVLFRVEDKCIQASRELKSILRGKRIEKSSMIKYTDLEQVILRILDMKGRVRKQEFMQETVYSSRKISDCLIRLVLAGVVKIIPTEAYDLYEFSQQN